MRARAFATALLTLAAGCSTHEAGRKTPCPPCAARGAQGAGSASAALGASCPRCPACRTGPPRRHGLLLGDAAREGIDKAKLDAMVKQAEAEQSSALVILKNGKLVYERYWKVGADDALITMSVSKSIASLAVGILLDKQKIKSVEQRVQDIVPELKDSKVGKTRLVRLLNHTSGLSPRRTKRRPEVGKLLEHATTTPLFTHPGTRFRYNNNAVDMLALVVWKATGLFLDDFLQTRLFGHLGVVGNYWMKWADGHPRVAGELLIRPVDLAKVGQLVLQGGKWNGKQLVSSAWIERSIQPSQKIYPPCGLLWWRHATFHPVLTKRELRTWRSGGVSAKVRRAAKRELLDKEYPSRDAYLAALEKLLGGKKQLEKLQKRAARYSLPLYNVIQKGPLSAFSARGSYGQYLVVVPKTKLVAVRMRLPSDEDYKRRGPALYEYKDFAEHAIGLATR
ncbi:MAG: serine hydrolase [Myxococcales bacterium]|nr:serine hydrolase [Myxococcales bacterium]